MRFACKTRGGPRPVQEQHRSVVPAACWQLCAKGSERYSRNMLYQSAVLSVALVLANVIQAQTQPGQVETFLEKALQSPDVTAAQLRQYLMKKAPRLPSPLTSEQWTAEEKRLRQDILNRVVFHGWPPEWVTAPLRIEDLGLLPSGPGYRVRKLRYEIVPGFQSTAILYEPETIQEKIPAILNVNGHVGPPGKAIEYKQKRCINQARQGILSLSLEWFFFGELSQPENEHWFQAHLNLTGTNGVGLFYLAMRKGLDYLYQHPSVDRRRIGVTGLSSGGWQAIILGALDDRVQVAIPVAGYASLVSRIERPSDTGDLEQNPTDLLLYADYPHLTAMRAPKPTLLIYNSEDDCCFRAPLVKPYVFDQVIPFFRLYGREDLFGWHENEDPGDHNYQLDNRLQSYRFFTRHFNLPIVANEIAVETEIKSTEELTVGLPKNNLTILGLARKLSGRIERGNGDTAKLREIVRYMDVNVENAWALNSSKSKGLETRSYRFDFSNGLSATGVLFKATTTSNSSSVTVILNDEGKKGSSQDISDRVNRGEKVLAVDLVFTGDSTPQDPGSYAYIQMLEAVGDRALGLEAAQLLALTRWLNTGKVRLRSSGSRSQVIALVAAALQPEVFSTVVTENGMPSLQHLLQAPIKYQAAPELFCLDLYKYFDVDSLTKMTGQTIAK